MTKNKSNICDVIVVGAGHAGIEAAMAASGLGADVILFTMSLDSIGNMPCNPSVGGTGKGHLVFEIDALGGVMGKMADKAMLQCRMLNTSKGPAVRSLRFQTDRKKYHTITKQMLENQKKLRIIQAEVTELILSDENKNGNEKEKKVCGVKTSFGTLYHSKTVVLCCGTYLDGSVIIGNVSVKCGADNSKSSVALTENLCKHGIKLMRFKTGTPARVHSDSINYDELEIQKGDEKIVYFSADTESKSDAEKVSMQKMQKNCYIAYTNEQTHKIITDNLHLSPMYSGQMKGTGARYCPSIEDKVVRFSDKNRHQLFIEPMGEDTKEMYIQGLSTSLPEDVQEQILHSVKGLENAVVMRYAYAIEYECSDPLQLYHSLEFKKISGLFGAGQFNGTSGYEEAAAQGLIAGINAALKVQNKEKFILGRDTSYIGMLIDDLVVKGTNEPYRVMTSRTEYRLLLRQDNADERLTPKGYELGLISEKRYKKLKSKLNFIEREIQRAKSTTILPTKEVNDVLKSLDSATILTGVKFFELLKRPELNYENLSSIDVNRYHFYDCVDSDFGFHDRKNLKNFVELLEEVQIRIRYDGYIKRQLADVEKQKKLESKQIPPNINYKELKGIRTEALQKLDKFRPANIGEASRISGISPADVTALLIILGRGGT